MTTTKRRSPTETARARGYKQGWEDGQEAGLEAAIDLAIAGLVAQVPKMDLATVAPLLLGGQAAIDAIQEALEGLR